MLNNTYYSQALKIEDDPSFVLQPKYQSVPAQVSEEFTKLRLFAQSLQAQIDNSHRLQSNIQSLGQRLKSLSREFYINMQTPKPVSYPSGQTPE